MSEDDLLDVLRIHGQEFLNLFPLPQSNPKKRKHTGDNDKRKDKVLKVAQDEEAEEWLGISGCVSELNENSSGDEGRSPDALYFP
jgi:hypothetical protein